MKYCMTEPCKQFALLADETFRKHSLARHLRASDSYECRRYYATVNSPLCLSHCITELRGKYQTLTIRCQHAVRLFAVQISADLNECPVGVFSRALDK
jgi:hypothetical protein